MALKDASREVRLQWFARQILDDARHGDVDGGDVQSYAEQAGLIVSQIATEEDIEKYDLDGTEPGDSFYRFSPDLEDVDWKQMADAEAVVS